MDFNQIVEQLAAEGALNAAPGAPEAPAQPGAHQPTARAAYDAAARGGQPAARAQRAQDTQPATQDTQPATPQQPTPKGGLTTPAMKDATVAKILASPEYTDVNHPRHAQSVAALSARYAEMFNEPEAGTPEADLGDLRRAAGMDVTIPAALQSVHRPAEERDFIQYAMREGLPSVTINRLVEFAVDAQVGLAGDDPEAMFQEKFATALTPAQRTQLIEWWRSGGSR